MGVIFGTKELYGNLLEMCEELGVDILETDIGQSSQTGNYMWASGDKNFKES